MSIVLVGGRYRLGEQYHIEAKKRGMKLHTVSQAGPDMTNKIECADAVMIFTNKVSHKTRNEAVTAAKNRIFRYSCTMPVVYAPCGSA